MIILIVEGDFWPLVPGMKGLGIVFPQPSHQKGTEAYTEGLGP